MCCLRLLALLCPSSHNDKNVDTTFLLDNTGSGSLGDLNSFAGNSFHSVHFDNSIVKHIEQMGMDPSRPVLFSSQSNSIRRREDDMESDDASSILKRKRN